MNILYGSRSARYRLDDSSGRARVSVCETLPYKLHVHIQVRHELRFASSVSPTSTRCPDMAVTREPSSILSRTESPWRPPCVCGVPRRIPRRLSTKIPPCPLYGEALAAPYIIERHPEAFHPRPVCLSQTALDLIVRVSSSQPGDACRWERRSSARSHRK